jgi:hypothetical protein
MSALADFDLGRLTAEFGCRTLVETGTGLGHGVETALAQDFEQIFSIEPKHHLALEVALRHADHHKVTIIHSRFEKGLKEALEEIPAAAKILFWLDGFDSPPALESALRLLASLRDIGGDVFLIDDAQLLEGEGPLRFVDDILGPSHRIERAGWLGAYPAGKRR